MADRSPLRLLRGVLVAATAASIGYQVVAMLAARRWRRSARHAEPEENAPLPVSILKPICGLEPQAEAGFASFCAQDHPDYELLFGVADPDDPAARVICRLAESYPATHVRLVPTTADLGPNRKVCNLHGLAAAARHELLLVSDSDMRVSPDYLRRVVAPFQDPRVGLVTCPYRGADPVGVPAALEALGIAGGFMPSVFVAALGDPCFAFGSTIALRRETLERIGGFAGLVEYLADDYQMGKRVADLGLRVHLSSVVVDSVLGRRSFRESWSRRLRWARTVRACRPLGHLGSGLTHTTALALLTALAVGMSEGTEMHRRDTEGARSLDGIDRMSRIAEGADSEIPVKSGFVRPGPIPKIPSIPSKNAPPLRALCGSAVSAFGSLATARAIATAALGIRLIAAGRVAVVELDSDAARRWFPLLPVSDLVETALWVASLFGRTVLWRGQRYRILEGGRIERMPGSRNTDLELRRAEADPTPGPIDLFQRSRVLDTTVGTLRLRPIRPGDEPELLAFFRDRLSPRSQYLFCPHDPSDPERCLQQFAERARRHAEGRDLAFVVELGGAVVGYFYLSGLDRADGVPPTLGIGVADELHGQGLGGVMMDQLLGCARSLGLPAVELTHESTNERAGRLYQSRGFIYTGAEERSGPGGARVERVMRWTAAEQPDDHQ